MSTTAESAPVSGGTAPPIDPEVEAKYQLIRSVGEECITDLELRRLVEKKPDFRLYDGFEPSGRMHIAQGVYKAMNVNKCTKAGGKFVFWVADWFALMNDKMGGDLDKIRVVGQYLVEVWKAAGMNMDRVEFLWAADEINSRPKEYWLQVLDIARKFNVNRITKCCQIMGRKEGSLTAAQLLYPIMQCTDIFFLKADVCQLGVDQRKVNMLAREYCDAIGRKLKPVILSHHMLYGLKQGQEKMSKSDPDSAIFMEDTREDVKRKIMAAFCPTEPEADEAPQTEESEGMHLTKDNLKNPCLDYVEYVLFCREGYTLDIGGKTYTTAAAVKDDFIAKVISEEQLKETLIDAINNLLEPVRDHFTNDDNARTLLETIRGYKKEDMSKPKAPAEAVELTPLVAVWAPLPTTTFLSLKTSFDLLQRVKLAKAKCKDVILYLPDWNAFISNCLLGEEAAIKAWFLLVVESMKLLDAATMEGVKIVYQSEHILASPSDYWVTVINAGRKFSVKRVEAIDPRTGSDAPVSDIIGALMHVADMSSLKVTEVIAASENEKLHAFAKEFPSNSHLALDVLVTSEFPLLKQSGEAADAECHISFTDSDMDVNSKMKKKCFCEPGNVTFCPPLDLAREVILPLLGKFELTRKDTDGGDKTYTTVEEMTEEFQADTLHPNDLKPNTARLLNNILDPIRKHFKGDAAAKKAVAELTKVAKKMAKKK